MHTALVCCLFNKGTNMSLPTQICIHTQALTFWKTANPKPAVPGKKKLHTIWMDTEISGANLEVLTVIDNLAILF
jgi:hypothetical protein